MRRLWTALGLASVLLLHDYSKAYRRSSRAEPSQEDAVPSIPFKLQRGFAIIVRGSIGSARNLNFLIDTGASPSVVDYRIARKLRLAVSSGQLSTFTRKVAVGQAIAVDVRLGSFHAGELRVLVHDLSPLEELLGVRVDAMVGYDFLGQGPFTIDYVSRTMLFGPLDPQLETIPYVSDLPYVVVLMRVQNAELPLLVDTGTHDLVVFEDGLEDILTKCPGKSNSTWTNLGGTEKMMSLDSSNSFLGAMQWSTREAFALQDSHSIYSAGFKGLLGVAALQSARVGFDPIRRVFAWESKIPRLTSAPNLARSSTGR